MKRLISILILALFFIGCTSTSDDLHKICITAEKIQNNDAINRTEKLPSFIKEISQLKLTDHTKKFINDLAMQQTSPTYQDFVNFAKENGLKNWECTALRELHKNL